MIPDSFADFVSQGLNIWIDDSLIYPTMFLYVFLTMVTSVSAKHPHISIAIELPAFSRCEYFNFQSDLRARP